MAKTPNPQNLEAQKIVNQLKASGLSNADIARRVGRDSSLISQIARKGNKGASLVSALKQVRAGATAVNVPRRTTKAGTPAKVSGKPVPAPKPRMPKFSKTSTASYVAKDEKALGADSPIDRNLNEAVSDFISDRGGLTGLSSDASNWLQNSSVSAIFDKYWHSGGFKSEDVMKGMTSVHNIRITERDNGDIGVEFDYDAEVDGYEIHGHASA